MDRLSLRFCSFVLLASAALCARTPAYAQDAPAAGGSIEDDSRKADELFKQGKSAYTAGKLQEAHDAYLRAWQLKRSHDIASNLGNTELQLGLKRDAAEHLAYCVRNFPPTVDETKRQNTMRKFEAARADVGALSIKTNVRGAEVFVDGKSVGVAPLEAEIYADPGERVVEARLPEHEPAIVKVQVVKAGATGAAQEVVLALVPKVKRDGPLSGSEAQPPPPLPPPTPAGPSKALIITGAALAGAGVVMGTTFALLSDAKASDAAAGRATMLTMGASAACGATPSASCQAVESAGQARATFANASAWSFIAGGALGAATVIYALAAPRAAKASATRVAPTLAVGGGGVVVRGEW
jgi:hypothetical protein